MNKKTPSPSTPNRGWFPKGRSGNLNGRPKRPHPSKGSAFEVLAEKTLTVAGGSGTREITLEEALQQRTLQDALAGKRIAQREVAKWIMKREAWLTKQAARAPQITQELPPFILSRFGAGICGFVGLDGGHDRDRTCDPYHVKVVLSR
jgi:hypothetical protein